MIGGKKILAVIPARGGSKSVPGKNLRLLGGKPLIAWTIEAARASKYIDRLVLSSDDANIIRTAKEFGLEAPFVRPARLAQDDTPAIDVVLHAIGALPGYDYVLYLQPTSPFRQTADIDGCIELCLERGAPACVSLSESADNPYWSFTLDGRGCMRRIFNNVSLASRRQDLPRTYSIDGFLFFAGIAWLLDKVKTGAHYGSPFYSDETLVYVSPGERSVDIDSEMDLLWHEFLLKEGGVK